MKPTTIILTALFCSVTIAQASDGPPQEAPPQYQHLKELEPFLGRWEGEFDPPGSVPKGIVRLDGEWLGNKSYVHFKITFTPDNSDIVLNPFNVFLGVNGETQATHAWILGLGSQGSVPASITKERLVMTGGKSVSMNGKPLSRTTTYELRSADELVVTNTEIKRDGQDLPDEDALVLKKVKSAN